MVLEIREKQLIETVGLGNYINAKKIEVENIKLVKKDENYYKSYYYYHVIDGNEVSRVHFSVTGSKINQLNCSCEHFYTYRSCSHVAAVFMNTFSVIKNEHDYSMEDFSKNLVLKFLEKVVNKSKVKIDILFVFNSASPYVEVKIKIGLDKMYSLGNKSKQFFDTYNNNDAAIEFGKYFIYRSDTHTFDEQDKRIISYLKDFYRSELKSVLLDGEQFIELLRLMGNKSYDIDDVANNLKSFRTGSPFKTELCTAGDKYSFQVDFDSSLILDKNFKFAFCNELYIIPDEISTLYRSLNSNNITELLLDENDAAMFSKNIYKNLTNYVIEDKIVPKFKVVIPDVNLYFDLNEDISCKLVFLYNGNQVSYFDDNEPFRNDDYENDILNDILGFGFTISKKKLILSDVDKQVEFMEDGIFKLNNNCNVFTTDKFKASNIINKSSIKSNFSIGKDNIMTYNFEMNDIDSSELDSLFKSMNANKKYYKLKNGNIINTQIKEIQELHDIVDNLGISSFEVSGIVPKYKALYLDSIKDYGIVNTGGLFNEFINNFKNNKQIKVNISKNNLQVLRNYQIDGVNWLYNIYKCDFGGILADEMGLGKTIQTIMFIKSILIEKPDVKILIIAPTSLIYNWEKEFLTFGSELKFQVIADHKKKRMETLEKDVNVLITTYGLLREDQGVYEKFDFEVVIIDEAQNIKNPKAGISKAVKTLNSKVRIALTGTPVENSVLEVWSIFDFIMPGFLNSLDKFQSKYNIKNIDEDSHEKLSELASIIKPFILRRKKKDVLSDLPDKLETAVYLDMNDEQKKYYALQVKKSKEEFEKLMNDEGFLKARFKILQLLTKLRQICIDPSIVFEEYDGSSVKIDEVINLVNNYILNGHKILLFTSFKSALGIVKSKLDEMNISNYVIDGSVKSRDRLELVEAFNKDNTNVFLITLKSGGTGLNLTSADVVIHLDLWWNPQVENQATDRAHRIGQKNTVEVLKLVCRGTIEEKILELQNKKKVLNDSLIDNKDIDDIVISKLEEDDIRHLLAFNE